MATALDLTPAPRAALTAGRPRPTAVVGRAVADRLGLATAVAVVILGLGLLTGALWPSLQDTFASLSVDIPEALLAVIGGLDLGTAAGWANAEVLSVSAPAAAIAVGLLSAARATAGEEESGTLGVLLSLPVRRSQVVLAKGAAMAVHVAVVGAGTVLGLLLGDAVGDMGLSTGGILAAGVHVTLLGWVFGAVALLVGAATGSRRVTTAVVGGLAGLGYAVANVLPLVDALADVDRLSPWYYATSTVPLVMGVDWGHLAVLAVMTAVVLAAAVRVLDRRDVRG